MIPITTHNLFCSSGMHMKGDEVARYRKVHLSRVSVGGDVTSEGV